MAFSVTAADFEKEVLNSPLPVLVDFWAEWCGPCRMLSPVIEEVSRELAGKIRVCKVNVDEEPDLAGRFAVMSIPALIVFDKGRAVRQSAGAMPRERLMELLKPYLPKE